QARHARRIVPLQRGLLPVVPAERAARHRSLQPDVAHRIPAGDGRSAVEIRKRQMSGSCTRRQPTPCNETGEQSKEGAVMNYRRRVWCLAVVAGLALGPGGCSKEPAEPTAPKTAPSADKAAEKAGQPAEPAAAKAPSVPGFNGVMKLDVRDSKEDWTPFT